MSRGKLWLFRFVALVIIPALFFVIVELALRIGGYGYDPSFFVRAPERDTHITNVRYGWRFFPRRIARAPLLFDIRQDKPEGVFRIFTLGASASLGFPDPAYSYGRVLEFMLEDAYPTTDFEVVNVGMTAINSHVVRLIARECADFDPDLFIVYLGNNEVVGPFGPGTVFDEFSSNTALIRSSIWVKSTRLGQLIESGARTLTGGENEDQTWGGMSMFLDKRVRLGDPRLESVYTSFQKNLEDICNVGAGAGANVLVCTVASNLKDNPPFSSVQKVGLIGEDADRWETLYNEGIAHQASEEWSEAIESFQEALRLDEEYAETHFRLGECYVQLGRMDEAREAFIAARDLDALRFRTDSRLNEAIREIIADRTDDRVTLVDIVDAIRNPEIDDNGIEGNDLFHEHVHLNFVGTYQLAARLYPEVIASLPDSIRGNDNPPSSPPSVQSCADGLALTIWDRYTIARDIDATMSQPPFTNQYDFEQRSNERKESLQRLNAAMTPDALARAEETYRQAISARPNDLMLRNKFGHLLNRIENPAEAAEQWRYVLDRLPEDSAAHNGLALALVSLGEPDEAIKHAQAALSLQPDFADAWTNLGLAYYARQQIPEAIKSYRTAIAHNPRHPQAHYNLGITLAATGKQDEAIETYRLAIEANPILMQAHNNLANILLTRGDIDEAITHYQQAIQINPAYLSAQRNLGIAYEQQGRIDEAIFQYETALQLNPNDAVAQRRLARLRHAKEMQEGGGEG